MTYGDVFGIIVKRLTKDAKHENEMEAAKTQSGSGVFGTRTLKIKQRRRIKEPVIIESLNVLSDKEGWRSSKKPTKNTR